MKHVSKEAVYVSMLVKRQYMKVCKLRGSICKHVSYEAVYVSMLVKRQYMQVC